MTLKNIKAMFKPGDKWHCIRDAKIKPRNETRTVNKVNGTEVEFLLTDGTPYHTYFPKASEILESRDGFLKFMLTMYDGEIVTVTLRKLPARPERILTPQDRQNHIAWCRNDDLANGEEWTTTRAAR